MISNFDGEEKFTFFVSDLIDAIKQEDEDEEMKIMKEIKFRFKLSDDQIQEE